MKFFIGFELVNPFYKSFFEFLRKIIEISKKLPITNE